MPADLVLPNVDLTVGVDRLFRGFTRAALKDPTPPGWAYAALATHPSVQERIELATAWERRHGTPR